MIMGISYVCLVEKCLTGFVGAPHKAIFLSDGFCRNYRMTFHRRATS